VKTAWFGAAALAAAGVLAVRSGEARAEDEANQVIAGDGRADTSFTRLEDSDRMYMISMQAATMAPMSFRLGTINQLQTVDALGSGYFSQVYADFALTSWFQVGMTVGYGTIGDPATQNVVSPTVYGKVQFLEQRSAGVNLAAAVNFKKIGFGALTDAHPNGGELEGQIIVDRRLGDVSLTANFIFGKSFDVPDADAELKLSAGYFLLPNLIVGLDTITRYDASFDGGPMDGTRYWEFTGGGIATWKVDRILLSLLAGVSAPMHTPVGTPGIGPTGMFQLGYQL
jgi:hypothetical protein